MIEIVLGVGLTVACAVIAQRQRRGLREGPSQQVAGMLPRLRRTSPRDRVQALSELATVTTWEGRLAKALVEAPSEAERVDAASEAVNDLAIGFGSRERWAATALRLQLLGGGLFCALGLVRGDLLAGFVALSICLVGGITVFSLTRPLSELERRQRESVDSLVSLLFPSTDSGGGRGGSPRRRGSRSSP